MHQKGSLPLPHQKYCVQSKKLAASEAVLTCVDILGHDPFRAWEQSHLGQPHLQEAREGRRANKIRRPDFQAWKSILSRASHPQNRYLAGRESLGCEAVFFQGCGDCRTFYPDPASTWI